MTATRIYLLLLFIAGSLCMQVDAQIRTVQKFEFEIRGGLTAPLGSYHGGTAQPSGALGIEGRYNLKGTPWDWGLMLDLSTARRSFGHQYNDDYDRWQSNRTLTYALTGDYNLRQGRMINPFAGAAIGVGFNDVVGDKYYPSSGASMVFAPRFGVEFLYHIRLMGQFYICRKGYNNFSLTLSLVIGGRPRK